MTPKPITHNTLFYGDNLTVLREHIPDESVDLIYLDPPFNSNRSYNVLFKDESGRDSDAQITAFEDTWHWGRKTGEAYHAIVTDAPERVKRTVIALHEIIGANEMMAYLVMMATRLVELHRVLKPTGSLYLHCDPTASHYLKLILDSIFGPLCYRNEIVWKRSSAHNDVRQGAKQPGRIHDILFFYTKSPTDWTWNPVYTPYDEKYMESNYNHIEEKTGRRFKSSDLTAAKPGGDTSYEWKGQRPPDGRYWAYSKENMQKFEDEGRIYYTTTGFPRLKHYLDEMPGIHIQSVWDDIHPVSAKAKERLDYPTQKPVALLERIVAASSNPGDVILDPFCGCGTAIAAAQKLGRKWIGIDITHLSIALQKYRLKDMFGLTAGVEYKVVGEPEDMGGANQLALDDRYQFQFWAVSLVRAKPLGGQEGSRQGKKGSDKGIDGVISFIDAADKPGKVLVQVKSGHVKSGDIRDLVGTVQREGAAIGVFITLQEPSRDMVTEAVSGGYYNLPPGVYGPDYGTEYPRIQILTIADLLNGSEIKMPSRQVMFKRAKPDTGPAKQEKFWL